MHSVSIAVFVLLLFSVVKDCRGCFSYNIQQSLTIKTGSSFYQECHCLLDEDSVDNIKWIGPSGQEIHSLGPGTQFNVFTEKQHRGVSLHIPRINKAISGVYKCVTKHNGKTYESKFIIDAYDPVYFVNTDEMQYIITGQNSTLRCEARGETEPLITWYKENEKESVRVFNSDKYSITEGKLIIKTVTDTDNGTYKCTASVLETGEESDKYIQAQLLTLPVIEDLKVTPSINVVAGEKLSIECLASGSPYPEYRWTKKDNMEEKNTSWHEDVNTITFDSIEPSDRGVYQCKAKNLAGEVLKEVNIEVLTPPKITVLSNITSSEGSIAQIICKATGKPPPGILLFTSKNGLDQDDDIIFDNRTSGEDESMLVLTFKNVKRSYAGNYVCNATNEVDSVEEDIEMVVLYKPYFEVQNELVWGWSGKTVNLSCTHESDPPSNITWKFQGNDIETNDQVNINRFLNQEINNENPVVTIKIDTKSYFGIYECYAINVIGMTKKTITLKEAFRPEAITNVTIMELTTTTVTFEIDLPVSDIDGPPILGIQAQYDEAENYKITNIHKNRTWSIDRQFKLEKLKPETKYYFRFAAINEVNIGDWSDLIDIVTLERPKPPKPVFDEDESSKNINKQTLKWKKAEETHNVDYYVIKYCPVSDEEVNKYLCQEERVITSQLDLTHLDANTTYYLELFAHNSKGYSLPATLYHTTSANKITSILSAEAMIGLSILVVIVCILAFDMILFACRRKGLIASCYYRKNKKRRDVKKFPRDKKGLLKNPKTSAPIQDNVTNSGHKQFEYNRTTGQITGKHSAV